MSDFNIEEYQKQALEILNESFRRCNIEKLIVFFKHSSEKEKYRVTMYLDPDMLSKYYSYLVSEHFKDIDSSYGSILCSDNKPNPFIRNVTFIKDLILLGDYKLFKEFCNKYGHQTDTVNKIDSNNIELIFSPVLIDGTIIDNNQNITIQTIQDSENWINLGYKYSIDNVQREGIYRSYDIAYQNALIEKFMQNYKTGVK